MNDRFENILKESVGRCTLCGECLTRCPQMEFTLDEAKREKLNLLEGRPSRVLSECTSCFACQTYCPNDADPHGLILYRWHEKRRKGAPFYLKPVLPGFDGPNPWSQVAKYYSPEEREFYDTLTEDAEGRDVLFLGCNQLFDPLVADSPLLKDLKAVASPGICCGEPLYRLGLLDQFEKAARKWADHWRKKSPAKMVFICPAGHNMITNLYTKRLGLKIDFPTTTLVDWLDDRLRDMDQPKPLGLSVILHDSCHAKMLGESFYNKTRRIFAWAGIEVVEMEKSKTDSLCCGFASVAARFNPADLVAQGRGRLAEAQRSKADAMAVYCNGCGVLFSVLNRYNTRRVALYHIMELLDMAMGHKPAHLSHKSAGRLAKSAVEALVKARLGLS